MALRQIIALASTLALAACSPGPAPVATSPNDPSNPRAPEGASPLPPANQPAEAPAGDHANHQGHMHGAPSPAGAASGAPSPAGAASGAPSPGQAAVYTCPMHPEVTSSLPGQCPKCGMNLVPKK